LVFLQPTPIFSATAFGTLLALFSFSVWSAAKHLRPKKNAHTFNKKMKSKALKKQNKNMQPINSSQIQDQKHYFDQHHILPSLPVHSDLETHTLKVTQTEYTACHRCMIRLSVYAGSGYTTLSDAT
jgi:hypothetical protein